MIYQAFIDLKLNNDLTKLLHKDETIKVKFEIDCHPALGFKSESKWIDMPEFAPIVVLDESSLFAGKLHAVLSRNYKNTVKGRDYYDFLFYVTNGVSPNLECLRNKLIDSKKIEHDDPFDTDILRDMLVKKLEQVDFDQVKRDAERFVINNEDLSHYCKDLFIQMAKKIK